MTVFLTFASFYSINTPSTISLGVSSNTSDITMAPILQEQQSQDPELQSNGVIEVKVFSYKTKNTVQALEFNPLCWEEISSLDT